MLLSYYFLKSRPQFREEKNMEMRVWLLSALFTTSGHRQLQQTGFKYLHTWLTQMCVTLQAQFAHNFALQNYKIQASDKKK